MPSAAPPVPRRERRRRDSTSPGFGGGCAERLEGPDRAGADPEKGGAGAGAEEEGAGRAPSATPAGRGFGASRTHSPLIIREDGREARRARTLRPNERQPGIPSLWLGVCLHQKAVG